MTRSNDLQATYDAADQRVHEAREALKAAQRERAQAKEAIAQARIPADLVEHLDKVRMAGELTPDEQANRDAAQAAYDAAVAAENPSKGAISQLLRGIDPKDGSTPVQRRGQGEQERQAVDERIRASRREAEQELGRLQAMSTRALRHRNAVIRRQDEARRLRRKTVKTQWDAAQAEKRRTSKGGRFRAFEFIREVLAQ